MSLMEKLFFFFGCCYSLEPDFIIGQCLSLCVLHSSHGGIQPKLILNLSQIIAKHHKNGTTHKISGQSVDKQFISG